MELQSTQMFVLSFAYQALKLVADGVNFHVIFLMLLGFIARNWTLAETVFVVFQLRHIGETTIAIRAPKNRMISSMEEISRLNPR